MFTPLTFKYVVCFQVVYFQFAYFQVVYFQVCLLYQLVNCLDARLYGQLSVEGKGGRAEERGKKREGLSSMLFVFKLFIFNLHTVNFVYITNW